MLIPYFRYAIARIDNTGKQQGKVSIFIVDNDISPERKSW
jgi:hypothetical protein